MRPGLQLQARTSHILLSRCKFTSSDRFRFVDAFCSGFISGHSGAGGGADAIARAGTASHCPSSPFIEIHSSFVSASYPGIRSLDNGIHHVVTLFAGKYLTSHCCRGCTHLLMPLRQASANFCCLIWSRKWLLVGCRIAGGDHLESTFIHLSLHFDNFCQF